MTIKQTSVVVELDNGNLHQVILTPEQLEAVESLIIMTSDNQKLKLLDTPINN